MLARPFRTALGKRRINGAMSRVIAVTAQQLVPARQLLRGGGSNDGSVHQMSLKWKLALRFLIAIVVIGALLFIPAGSFRFWQGWVYILTTFVPGVLAFAYFYKHDPQLIERRMQFKEKVLTALLLPLCYGSHSDLNKSV
jgi:hypothetical protein